MALTVTQKQRIIFYLGWPGLTIVSGSVLYHSVINDRLNSTTTEIEVIVRELLDQLELIDRQLEEARCRLTASQVDDVKLNKEEIHCLKKERRRYSRELSETLQIPINSGGYNAMFGVRK